MKRIHRRRGLALAASVAGLGLVLTACSSGDSGDGGTGGGDDNASADCEAYEQYGDLEGTEVTVYTSIVAPEDQPHIDSYKPFEDCTGATVVYEGSKEFEAQLLVRLEAGNPPDIAYIPQPGLLQTIVEDFPDQIVPASEGTVANVEEYYAESWKGYGTVDGTFYAAPLGANVKSFVWYSPAVFEENGYEIPETWDDLVALSDQIVEDHAAEGKKPWCAGIGSGDATGWPATDWLEDLVLRTAGGDVYDQWVNHEIPFNDPQIATALGEVGSILKNPDYVNGGLGDVSSIASTTFQDGGLPIVTNGLCFMHRQASFYAANFPEGTTVAEDGDVFAFYLPGPDTETRPLLGGGEFAAAFSDRPEVAAFQAFLASPEWNNAKAIATPGGGWVSANSGLDPENLTSEIDQLSATLLSDTSQEFRFDASDLMPAAVGAGAFWTEMTAWIANDKDDAAVLDAIEGAWPSS
ncbi:extracellular solute-binding protein family 1 [Cellulomonas flavigena DSM 20109]|uniref:Extracellular solute-binding protein family 1 n=1 Tax=Cellulomonas flavigena (strain ATCC 482 / DSM 20109 / BCRC 11376 / JCM 18109 / NBRC 3775 / NCIMB 8073 / NRS 134) TaxID=446466 RepID=D5ULV8_CELFN|nr:ABC transporter substrate-binding protein [Cellulomonas flavigena]ADG76064.1 extracellular solute-binding protein family 1 [Cellulomonas flavigena DSM 20109]